MTPLTTQEQLSEAHLLRAGLRFYLSLLRAQHAQTLAEVELLESQLALNETQHLDVALRVWRYSLVEAVQPSNPVQQQSPQHS